MKLLSDFKKGADFTAPHNAFYHKACRKTASADAGRPFIFFYARRKDKCDIEHLQKA